ncbi:MAG: 50S ribosomal protein L3 [Chloroflexi bacterium]|nr:50S ribosomal protein L3 [Chloroflexota bacterium]
MNGLLGKKLGMTQLFVEKGVAVATTVLAVGPCVVTQVKTKETDGYDAVQVGYGEAKNITKARLGQMAGQGKFRFLKEFRVEDASGYNVGDKFESSIFNVGDVVDVTGTSKGRGFAGTVKRHGFAGGPKTHGQSDRWRAPGSIGASASPGRVFKGMRMAGHFGNETVTTKKITVVATDNERNLVMVKGSVPGAKNSLIVVKKAGGAK